MLYLDQIRTWLVQILFTVYKIILNKKADPFSLNFQDDCTVGGIILYFKTLV